MSRTRYRRTKIVATLGPSWESRDGMIALLDAGVDVVRINASHGTPEIRIGWIRQLREVLAESLTVRVVDRFGNPVPSVVVRSTSPGATSMSRTTAVSAGAGGTGREARARSRPRPATN